MLRRLLVLAGLAVVSLLVFAGSRPNPSATAASYPPLEAQTAVVASDADLASQVGVLILERGGNAADAAVATALTLGVVHPFASGIGGGGFALYYDRATDLVTVFDFREMAPAGASRDMFLVDGGAVSELSLRSGLAVGVPGEIAGLWALHQRYGRLDWADVVAPATQLAREGFEVDGLLARRLRARRADLVARPALFAVFQGSDGDFVQAGDRLTRPRLAETLAIVAELGLDSFYAGQVGAAIIQTVDEAGGVMTSDDLANYVVAEREPVVARLRGYTFFTMPPPSSGGITTVEILNILEGFELNSMGHNSSAYVHTLVEAMQYAFADRALHLGDPDFVQVPIEDLTDLELGRRRAATINPDQTLPQDTYGVDIAPPPDDSGTAHFSIIDGERNMLALTTTINTSFGSMLFSTETGIILNNEMDDFSAQPGVPNAYGLVGAEANAIAPGRRPLSSMSPTLVFRDGAPFMTVGGSGGPRIITATLQVILNVITHGMTVSEAIDAPRIHHQWTPDILMVEPEIPIDVLTNLEGRGHEIREVGHMAAVQAIVIEGDVLYAASDPRKAGHPAGY